MILVLERLAFYLGIFALVAILACAVFGAEPSEQPAKEIAAQELLQKVDGLIEGSEEQGEHEDRVKKLLEESGKQIKKSGQLMRDNDVADGEARFIRLEYQGKDWDDGMLFADCGSPQWDKSFRAFVKTLFPKNALRVIADDDPIFQIPFTFPKGAPPLWHHGGNKAKGVKLKGRWCVFYFPGDLNDAWKTGHSGIDPELAESAFRLGTNIVYYSFAHYLQETRK